MEMNTATSLLQRQLYLYFPTTEEEVYLNGKSKVRRLFDGQIQYDEEELNYINQLDEYLQKNNFNPIIEWNISQKLRFLYANKFKLEKTMQSMNFYTEWRLSSIPPKMNPLALQFLQKGIIYTLGRDHRFRPIIIIDIFEFKKVANDDITTCLDAMTILFEFILARMFLPGQIENWVVILDLGDLGITSLPRHQLQQIMTYLQNNYRSRMFKCYVVRSPRTISFSWNIIKQFLEEVTVQKISFYNTRTADPLFEHCNRSQVEAKYGGSQSDIKKNFWQVSKKLIQENRPPQNLSNQYLVSSDKNKQIFISEEEYYLKFKQGLLINNIKCQEIIIDQENKNKTGIYEKKSSVSELSPQFLQQQSQIFDGGQGDNMSFSKFQIQENKQITIQGEKLIESLIIAKEQHINKIYISNFCVNLSHHNNSQQDLCSNFTFTKSRQI